MLRHALLCLLLFCYLSGVVSRAQVVSTSRQQTDPQPQILLLRVYSLAEKTLALKDIRARTMGTALIAEALWQDDETYSRQLFEKALAFTSAGEAKEQNLRALLRKNVIVLIAGRDAAWAKRLLDKQDANTDQSPSEKREAEIRTARSLVELQPD